MVWPFSQIHHRCFPSYKAPPGNMSTSSTMEKSKTRTYGSKRSSRTTAAAAAIFGPTAVPSTSQRVTVEVLRHPVNEITESFGKLQLKGDSADQHGGFNNSYQKGEVAKVGRSSKSIPTAATSKRENDRKSQREPRERELKKDPNAFLRPLLDAYQKDRGYPLHIRAWDELLPADVKIEKIAEASYAEVYRLSNEFGTSIIKVMQLKTPINGATDSESYTALDVESVVSEFRIMNAVTEIPGFVEFKDAHLVKGRPPSSISKAYYDFITSKAPKSYESSFPDPKSFNDESVFFFIELGDAGVVLDKVLLEDIDIVWDVLLGVIIALSRAELLLEFEHRDLHESNICVKGTRHDPPPHPKDPKSRLKYGFSGFEITLLDYGLSRATLPNSDTVFFDLEKDLEIFRGDSRMLNTLQFETYRRMRTYLFTGTRSCHPKRWHDDASRELSNGHSWNEFIPYTNVLWIRAILHYLIKTWTGNKDVLKRFKRDIVELEHRLHPRVTIEDGAFETAHGVLEFIVEQGWVTEQQLEGADGDSSWLSM
ncbi:hypothetical protein F5884DRAFT_800175 [Xylogone sp. PMI_703]|nr:hypothetical protein F5884DRAFT_800175 [Xylogone sp. PMI_703]